MAEVEGIGGVFIDSEDAAALARWYEAKLGIEMEGHPDGTGYYHVFLTRDPGSSILRENPVFAINQAREPLAAAGRGFMLNLRVDDLDEMLVRLGESGVEVEEKILEWAQGKHGWIRDLDGNRIELYQELFPEEGG